jgi:hypothetical protein
VRFLLEDSPPTGVGPRLGTVIQPITDADALLRELTADTDDVNISGTAGSWVTFKTVPAGKRWKCWMITQQATSSASQLAITMGTPGVEPVIRITESTNDLILFQGPLELDEGWSIVAATSGNGSDSGREHGIIYEEEDAY